MQFLWAPSVTISCNFQKDVKCAAARENCVEGKLKKKKKYYLKCICSYNMNSRSLLYHLKLTDSKKYPPPHTHTCACAFTSTEQFVMSRSKIRHCHVKTRHLLNNVSDKPLEC